MVFGKVNPGGKLPVSFPRRLGQVPIYYNHEPTGRPCNADSKYNSRHRDIPSCAPLFAFGYGLSYTTFEVSNLQLSSTTVSRHRSLTASVSVKNTGTRNGGSITAAQFLQRFVADTPWAHLDIAGTAMAVPATDINHSWGSGYGVRLLDRLVAEYYEAAK